ncbi:MAG: hypothetical protein PHS49_03345 [Candidatus Gracilibacteria bacterium]|nr:hypothetical protein [Candidatus Gracilibacteria bacterium]
MRKIKEYQFAELIQVATNQLVYCKKIIELPGDENMFSLNDISSSFLKRVCNACFIESCLIICNLLKENDKRVISLFNWVELVDNKSYKLILDGILKTDEYKRLVECRDQIFGHQDISNGNNNFPNHRLNGIMNLLLINDAEKILDVLIKIFDCFTREKNTPYDLNSYFGTIKSEEEIEYILNEIKPKIEKISS